MLYLHNFYIINLILLRTNSILHYLSDEKQNTNFVDKRSVQTEREKLESVMI